MEEKGTEFAFLEQIEKGKGGEMVVVWRINVITGKFYIFLEWEIFVGKVAQSEEQELGGSLVV